MKTHCTPEIGAPILRLPERGGLACRFGTALLLALAAPCFSTAFAQGTAFTYQGRLNVNGSPAAGSYDFIFRLSGDALGVNLVGNPCVTNGIALSTGLFTTALDFGPGIFTGSNYWLVIQVRTNGGGSYNTLTPLQPLTPAPYAVFSEESSNLLGVLPASQLSGTILNASLPSSPNFAGTVTAGALSGSGANVSNVNAATLNGLNSGQLWQLGGNTVSPGQFLGSTNNQPVELRVNNEPALRIESGSGGVPNVIGGVSNAVAPGSYGSFIGGGAGHQILPSTSYATIVGGYQNTNDASQGTIGGGIHNSIVGILTDYSMIAGGAGNLINQGSSSTIGGGDDNQMYNSPGSVISGGEDNTMQFLSVNSVIGGGQFNSIFGSGGYYFMTYAVVGGGESNVINASYATIPGGWNNLATGNYSLAAGSSAQAVHDGAFVWADSQAAPFASTATNQFSVRAGGGVRFVTGGAGLTLDGAPVLVGGYGNVASASEAFVGGGVSNTASGYAAFVGGGGELYGGNTASGNQSVVVGGLNNTATGSQSFIGGGVNNLSTNTYATVAGGGWNVAGGNFSTVGGGYFNIATGYNATIPGGQLNLAGGQYSFAAGLRALALHDGTFVWADSLNIPFASTSSNQFLVRASGGVGINTASTPDSNLCINTNTYLFSHTMYLRGETGSDHNHGLAYNGTSVTNFGNGNAQIDGPALWGFNGGVLGTMNGGARAILTWSNNGVAINAPNPNGAALFVQGNRTGPFGSAVGVFENTNHAVNNAPALRVLNDGGTNADGALSVSANVPAGAPNGLIAEFGNNTSFVVTITNDGTIYCRNTVTSSDRNLKEHFTALDPELILAKVAALPITEWNFKDDTAQKHLGPMAQDFRAAFGLGPDDTHISTVDEGGVALAAIQGLNRKLLEKDAELTALQRRNAALEERLERLEKSILNARIQN